MTLKNLPTYINFGSGNGHSCQVYISISDTCLLNKPSNYQFG